MALCGSPSLRNAGVVTGDAEPRRGGRGIASKPPCAILRRLAAIRDFVVFWTTPRERTTRTRDALRVIVLGARHGSRTQGPKTIGSPSRAAEEQQEQSADRREGAQDGTPADPFLQHPNGQGQNEDGSQRA